MLNGVVGLDLEGSQDIADLASNLLPPGEPVVDETYTVDNTPPTLLSFTRQNPFTTQTNADVLVFRATFDEDVVNVDTSDFAVNGTTAMVTGVSLVSASTYDVTVSGGDLASLDGVVSLDLDGSQNIADLVGNLLPPGEPVVEHVYVVDNTPPILLSFARQIPSTNPTNADTLVFRATFDEGAISVGSSGFTVHGTTATVTNVSVVTFTVYDITVSGGDLALLNGVVGLDLNGSQFITDLARNSLPLGEPSVDETYTVDNAPPTLLSFTRENPFTSQTNADVLVFRATFDEDVVNVDTSDFAVSGTTAMVTGVSPVSAGVYDVTVSGGDLASLDGVVGLGPGRFAGHH